MSLIHQKLSIIASKISPINKTGNNKDDNYKFKSNEDVYFQLQPLFKAEGIIIIPEVLESSETIIDTNKGRAFKARLKVKWTFVAQDASSFDCVMIGEALDTSDKASNKAMTASLKYLLIYMFLIPAQYMPDADSNSIKITPFNKPNQDKVDAPKSLLAFAESRGLTRNELAKIGEELGLDIDAELSSDSRKLLYQAILKSKE